MLANPVAEQFTGPSPSGLCPDWREVIAADISLLGLCVFAAAFVGDEFEDRTTGAISAAIDKKAKNRAVKEFR